MAERVLNGVNNPEELRNLRQSYRDLPASRTAKGKEVLKSITEKIIELDPNCFEARLRNIPILRRFL